MQDEFATDHTVNWYVSRTVDVVAEKMRAVRLPEVVAGSNGVTLTIGRPVFVDDEQYRSFEAVLSYPGVLFGKVHVELDLNPYSSCFGELGLRPTNHVPRLLSAERYFDGAWSILDALAAELASGEKRAELDAGRAA